MHLRFANCAFDVIISVTTPAVFLQHLGFGPFNKFGFSECSPKEIWVNFRKKTGYYCCFMHDLTDLVQWIVVMHFSWCLLQHVATRIPATLRLTTSKSTPEPAAETVTSSLTSSLSHRYITSNLRQLIAATFSSCDAFLRLCENLLFILILLTIYILHSKLIPIQVLSDFNTVVLTYTFSFMDDIYTDFYNSQRIRLRLW